MNRFTFTWADHECLAIVFELENSESIENVTRIFFNQKRKKIKKPLDKLFKNSEKIAKKLDLNLDLRPQNLDYETYFRLAKELEKLKS